MNRSGQRTSIEFRLSDKMEPTLKMSIQRGNYGSSRMTWPRFYATCSFTNIKENILEFDFQHVDQICVLPTIKCRDFTSQENLSRPEFSEDGWRDVFQMFGQMKPLDIFAFLLAMVPNDSHVNDLLVYACKSLWDSQNGYSDGLNYIRVVQ